MTILFRFLWAVFLAIIVAINFSQSWKQEHGRYRKKGESQDETMVYISPLVFPIVIFGVIIITIAFCGMREGIVQFTEIVMDVFLCMSVYFVILLLVLPFLRKRFSARVCAVLWIAPVFLFWQPHMLLSATAYTSNQGVSLHTVCIPESILRGFAYVWVSVFLMIFGWQILSHFLFRHKLMKGARPVEDEEVLKIWDRERKRLRYKKPIRLLYTPNTATPLSVGMYNESRATCLPEREFTADELRLIFRHELHHVQRRDVDTKVFLGFCKALFWFNPLTWVAARKASDDLELACDEIALRKAEGSERHQYAELLLNTAGNSQGFSTCLSAAATSLRYRLKNVIAPGKRRVGPFLLAIAIFCCCMSYGSVVLVSERGTVGELCFPSNVTAKDVTELDFYDDEEHGKATEGSTWRSLESCDEKMLSWLKGLKVEKMFSDSKADPGGEPEFSWWIETDRELHMDLTGKMLSVYIGGEDNSDYYLVRSEIDWDYVRACFKEGKLEKDE